MKDKLFKLINDLVLCHSPSGVETEIDHFLLDHLAKMKLDHWQDDAGNIIIKIKGKSAKQSIAITAHKDEIGAIVKNIKDDGKLEVRKLGGTFPWIYGEGVVDILGSKKTVPGILSFGSRHVSHESPQKVYQEEKPLKWENVWVDTKCPKKKLEEAGVQAGTRVVIGKHRKAPIRLGDYVASYSLDNKASLAVLLMLAENLKQPAYDTYLVASAKEEVGAIGAMYFAKHNPVDKIIALEICPKSCEFNLDSYETPVLLAQDRATPYDVELNEQLQKTAKELKIPLQTTVLSCFASDASYAMMNGYVAKAACLCFLADNTHGYEIAHLASLVNCYGILKSWL